MEIENFENDLLDRAEFADRLEKFIEVEHNFVEGSLVLALSSKFGSGKTTFLKMWKSKLENRDEQDEKVLVVSLNAWESDYYGDPLFAIVSSLVESLSTEDNTKNTLIDAAKVLGNFSMAMAGQMTKKLSGIDPVKAGEDAKKKKVKREGIARVLLDAFSIFLGRKDAMKELQIAIKNAVQKFQGKVIFFVDELDRCRPDYAISYLETIKHIFDVKGAVFILAADRDQLENSAKTAFGSGLDFEEYYRKFIHREITLPSISDSCYEKLAANYVDHFLDCETLRNCYMDINSRDDREDLKLLVSALRLTPRQIQEAFRILGHLFSTKNEKERKLSRCNTVASIMMVTFKIGNPRVYELLGTRQLEVSEIRKFFSELNVDHYALVFWKLLILSGNGIKQGKTTDVDLILQFGLTQDTNESEHALEEQLRRMKAGWGYQTVNHFVQIYDRVEQILQWN